jgi:hypothetical protein
MYGSRTIAPLCVARLDYPSLSLFRPRFSFILCAASDAEMNPGPSHFALADRLLDAWRAAGFEALCVRKDGRVVPTRFDEIDDVRCVESYLINAAEARDAIARSAAGGVRY